MATAEQTDKSGLANVGEGSKYLGVSVPKIYLLMSSGELPYVKIGKCRRIRWADIYLFVDRNTHGGHAAVEPIEPEPISLPAARPAPKPAKPGRKPVKAGGRRNG